MATELLTMKPKDLDFESHEFRDLTAGESNCPTEDIL